MIYIFDNAENLLEVITEYKEFKYIKKLNSDRSLSFEVEKNNNIKKYNKVGFFDNDMNFQLFFIDDITSFKDNKIEKISVDCLADFFNLGNTIIDDKRATTINDAVTKCLENSDYKVGIVESFEDRNINFYHISRIKALNEIINTYKCEIDIRVEINESTGRIGNKFIDFKHRLGTDTGIRFTYDTALESVEKDTLGGHFNVLWGWGKSLETENGGYSRKLDFADINNNKKYVEDVASIKKYGRLEGIFEDSKIEDKAILLKATKERLEDVKILKVSYKASIKDISKLIGYEHFKIHLGDTIVILDEEINEVIEARIIGTEEVKEDESSESDIKINLGNFLPALSDDDLDDILGNLNDKIDNIPKPDIPNIDTIYPDTLPNIPVAEATGLFSSVILSWTYSNKTYYTYEVFASKVKDFKPDNSNRIFEGKASSYLHEVKPSETWYYRVRGKNSYGKVTDYSNQVEATTKKIADGTQYFEELAIGHALIASLDLDKATVGKLTAQFLDVYNLVVKDGNDNITLRVDDFGRIYMNVTELKISSKSVETESGALAKIQEAINEYNKLIDKEFDDVINAYVDLEAEMNGAFRDGVVSQSEAISIRNRISQLEKEKADIEKEFNTVYNNANLKDTTEKENLLKSYDDYVEKFTDLKESILESITDDLINSDEITLINNKTDLYKLSSAKFKEDFTKAIDKVGSVKVNVVAEKTELVNTKLTEVKQTSENFQVKTTSTMNQVNLIENANLKGKDNTNAWVLPANVYWGKIDGKVGIGRTEHGHNEASIHSTAINLKNTGRNLSISANMHAERNTYGAQVFLIGSITREFKHDWAHMCLEYGHLDGEITKEAPNIWIPDHINYLWVRVDHEGWNGVSDYRYVYINWINLIKGDKCYSDRGLESNGFAEGVTTLNQNGMQCDFENGTRMEAGRGGFYYKTGDGQWEYHALSLVGSISVPSEETRYIYLPEVFRNKNIRVICQVSQIGNGTDAINNPKPIISFWAGATDIQNNPGHAAPYFGVYASTRLKNDDGSIAYRDKAVLVTYTVVA